MNMIEKCRKLPQASQETWEGGWRKAPFWITEETEKPYRPVLELWAEQHTEGIVHFKLAQEMPPLQQSVDLLLEAMAKPMIGPPRRPTHIRVSKAPFGEFLGKELATLAITVELTDRCPLFEKVVTDMCRNMASASDQDALPALTSLTGLAPERVGAFYRTAASFYQQAPWRFISDAQPLKISCPAFSHNPVYLVVMGQGGMEFGLGVFFTIEELEQLYAVGDHIGSALPPSRTVSLLFSEPLYLAFDDLDAIEQHGWPVASSEAYPLIYQILPEREPQVQPPSPAHLDIFEACLLALPKTIETHRASLRTGRGFAEEVSVETFHGRRELRIEAV